LRATIRVHRLSSPTTLSHHKMNHHRIVCSNDRKRTRRYWRVENLETNDYIFLYRPYEISRYTPFCLYFSKRGEGEMVVFLFVFTTLSARCFAWLCARNERAWFMVKHLGDSGRNLTKERARCLKFTEPQEIIDISKYPGFITYKRNYFLSLVKINSSFALIFSTLTRKSVILLYYRLKFGLL